MDQINHSDFLTADEVSALLRIPLRTIYNLSKSGKIRGVKIGKLWRYKESDIREYYNLGTDFSKKPARRPDNPALPQDKPPHPYPLPAGEREGHFSTPPPIYLPQDIYRGTGFPERRAYPRINSNFKCSYSINLLPFKVINNVGVIKGLSAGGILLVNQNDGINGINNIDINDPISIQFILIQDNGKETEVSAKGRVVRKIQDAVGIKFKSMDRDIKNKIIKYVG